MAEPEMESDASSGIIEYKAYARIGLLGNPSDVYFGRTISLSIGNFWASVRLEPSLELVIQPHPTHDLVRFDGFQHLPLMIIKGLFRRYERWNPVHPTYGAFWGMGFGIGCGVGWGPGFGPEVIGYVGAGCGIGFSVGITLAGIGIGLPANFLFQIPCNALARAKNCTLEFVHSTTLSSTKNATQYGWTQLGPNIKGFGNEAIGRFTNLKMNVLDHRLEFPELNKNLSSHAKSTLERMKSLKEQLFPTTPGTGSSST